MPQEKLVITNGGLKLFYQSFHELNAASDKLEENQYMLMAKIEQLNEEKQQKLQAIEAEYSAKFNALMQKLHAASEEQATIALARQKFMDAATVLYNQVGGVDVTKGE